MLIAGQAVYAPGFTEPAQGVERLAEGDQGAGALWGVDHAVVGGTVSPAASTGAPSR